MADRIPGVLLDGSEGSMIELAESLSLQRFIDRHNDPHDPYHLHPHEAVCCVRFLHTATQSMRSRISRIARTAGGRNSFIWTALTSFANTSLESLVSA
jgi:hypothetical protein